ncbi:MAG: hypothetical protein KDN22_07135 [Verrucomicrobiae bacterium]|nr:hypothetical protein [Verrucomicrobiae bacterium]
MKPLRIALVLFIALTGLLRGEENQFEATIVKIDAAADDIAALKRDVLSRLKLEEEGQKNARPAGKRAHPIVELVSISAKNCTDVLLTAAKARRLICQTIENLPLKSGTRAAVVPSLVQRTPEKKLEPLKFDPVFQKESLKVTLTVYSGKRGCEFQIGDTQSALLILEGPLGAESLVAVRVLQTEGRGRETARAN